MSKYWNREQFTLEPAKLRLLQPAQRQIPQRQHTAHDLQLASGPQDARHLGQRNTNVHVLIRSVAHNNIEFARTKGQRLSTAVDD